MEEDAAAVGDAGVAFFSLRSFAAAARRLVCGLGRPSSAASSTCVIPPRARKIFSDSFFLRLIAMSRQVSPALFMAFTLPVVLSRSLSATMSSRTTARNTADWSMEFVSLLGGTLFDISPRGGSVQ